MFSLLHIDRNFFYREIVHRLSTERDFQYFSASSPSLAYELLERQRVDIIVTGLEFEGESEEAFIAKLLKVKSPDTAVIVLSALENDVMKARLLEMGVTEFLQKDNFLAYLTRLIVRLEANDLIVSKLKTLEIAILDDDQIHRKQMRDILCRHDICRVDLFQSAKALFECQKHYDIYLVDFIMPDASGNDVILELRSRDEYSVIVAVSSVVSHNVVSNLLMTGADDFIPKPFTENLFIARLKANVRTFSLLEQLKEKNQRLSQMAIEDGLTGLYNHRHVIETLNLEMERAHRDGSQLSILLFDIDHFKIVNDTYGHHMGDQVLAGIGALWKEASRRIDIAGRYGGEEFLIILPNTSYDAALHYADRLRQQIEDLSFGTAAIKITVSGGVATYSNSQPGDTSQEASEKLETAEDLVKRADIQLYKAKDGGRNRMA